MSVKKRFPNVILNMLKKLPKKFSGLCLIDPYPNSSKIFDDWTFHDIKVANEEFITEMSKEGVRVLKQNPPKVVFFPNFYGLANISGVKSNVLERVAVLEEACGQKRCFYFLDERTRKEIRTRPLITEKFYFYVALINNELCVLYSLKRLEENTRYWIKALEIPFVSSPESDKIIAGRYVVVDCRKFRENFTDVKEKMFDSIMDLNLIWDFERGIPIYDDIEVFIILSSVFFVMLSYPAINLLICGLTGARKTAWFDMFKEIFGDEYVASQWATSKGMVASHYGDKPQAGVLFRANFVSMVDEFFRRFLSDTKMVARSGQPNILIAGLSDYMNILEHKPMNFPSGKGNLRLRLKTSFIGTDNLLYRTCIPDVWMIDKAVLRRFTWLLVSEDTTLKGQKAKNYDTDEAKMNLLRLFKKNKTFDSFGEYAKFGRYAREEIPKLAFTEKDGDYVNSLLASVQNKYKTTFFVDTPARALFMCWKFFSNHIRNFSLDIYEKAFWRIVEDAKKVLEPRKFQDKFRESRDETLL